MRSAFIVLMAAFLFSGCGFFGGSPTTKRRVTFEVNHQGRPINESADQQP